MLSELAILITEDAEQDLLDSAQWYEDQQEGLSDRFITEASEKILLIAENTSLYPTWKGKKQMAFLNVFPFIILFRVVKSKNTLAILAIFHTSRNPKQKSRRKF